MSPLKEGAGAPFVQSTMTAPLQKKWFRIEQAADGSILSCTEADTQGESDAHVRYYESPSAADACAQARAWHINWLEQCQRQAEARRDGFAAKAAAVRISRLKSGQCVVCGSASQTDECDTCVYLARNRSRNGCHRAPGPPAATCSTDAYVARVKAKWGSATAKQYALLLKHFDETSPRDFRAWLVGKITQLGGAKALAEYESSRAESLDKQSTAAHKRAAKHLRSA